MHTYQQTIDYLFSRLPMFSRLGAVAYKADLNNTIRLCEALGNPHLKFKSIHVAGTNGKGSTSHMLASVIQSSGYKTGLYTSPHLQDFRERIKINGEMVTEQFVIDFTRKIKPIIEEIEPSFFEITVAMAFEWFALQKVDLAVIETGLGGRLDSTNIITPEFSVITNIGMDHMNLLGNTIDKIAFEKAGIIKKATPVVIGETLAETLPVFETKATEMQSDLHIARHEWWITDTQTEGHLLKVIVADKSNDERKTYHLDLSGRYQLKNLLTVLSSIKILRNMGWQIAEENIETGLSHVRKNTGLHGRWEIIHQHPKVVLDVGHNEDGIKEIIGQLEHENFQKLHIILGFVKDKDVEKVLSLLPHYPTYYFTKAQIPRAMDETELMKKANRFNLFGKQYADVNTALADALTKSAKDDLVLVCGSVFLVGEVTLPKL